MSRWTMPLLVGVLQPQRRLVDEVAGVGHRQRPLALTSLARSSPSTYSMAKTRLSPSREAE